MKKKASKKKKIAILSLLKTGNKKWIKTATIGSLTLAVVIIMGAIKMFAVGSIAITSPSDGSTTDRIQTFSGTATPGSTVGVYSRIANIDLATGADPFTLTYQAANPAPGYFSDNFSTFSQNYWGSPETHDGGTANTGSSGLTTFVTGASSVAFLHTNSPAAFDLASAPKPLYLETNLTINSASGSGYNIQFSIDNCVPGSPSCISVGIFTNDSGISYQYNDGANSGGGSLTSVAPTIGQKMKLRIEIDSNTIQFKLATHSDDPFDYTSSLATFNVWSGGTRINIGVNNGVSTGSVSTTWDTLMSAFPLAPTPAGYLLPNIPLKYDGVDYNAQAVFFGSDFSTQVNPGGIIPESFLGNKDVYVYLINSSVPFIGGATIYTDANPVLWASTIIPALSGMLSDTFTVNAYAMAFAHPSSGMTYSPASLPIPSAGSITESGVGDPGTLLPRSTPDILLATTTTGLNGNWSVTLSRSLSQGTYTIIAKSSPDGESAPITIVVPPPPPPTYIPSPIDETIVPMPEVPAPIEEKVPVLTLDEALAKIKDLEQQITNLTKENSDLKNEIDKLQSPAQSITAPLAPSTPPTPIVENIYTVMKGDTLFSIARKLYNNVASYTKLIDLNKYRYPALELSPNIIEVGWQFNY